MDDEDTMREQLNGPRMLVWAVIIGAVALGALYLLTHWLFF